MIRNAKIVATDANSVEYHAQVAQRGAADFVMSSSHIRWFAASPSKWRAGWEPAKTISLEYGSLFDALVLTPAQFDKRYAVIPATYKSKALRCPSCGSVSDAATCRKCDEDREPCIIEKPWNGNSEVCHTWLKDAEKEGLEVVSQDDLKKAQDAKARLLADAQCKKFLEACDKQVWIVAEWHDEATGLIIPLKCLIDLAGREDSAFPKSLGDLKSTKSAAIIPWASWAHKVGYDIQAAWNTDLFVAATKREITNFCFVLSENETPFEIGRRFMEQDLLEPGMDTGDIASGRRQYVALLKGYCQCLKRGFWPGYDDTDEASADGWTLLSPSPWDEQRRMFAPKFQYAAEEPEPDEAVEEENDGDIPP